MRHDADHPRSWSALLEILSADEAAGCRAFARSRGINIELASAPDVEGVFTEWRVAGSPPASDDECRYH